MESTSRDLAMSDVKIIKFPNKINDSVLTINCLEKDLVVVASIIFISSIFISFFTFFLIFNDPMAIILPSTVISSIIFKIYFDLKKNKEIKRGHYRHFAIARGFHLICVLEKKRFLGKGIHPSYFPYGSETIFRD